MNHLEYFWSIADFYYNNPTNTCHLSTFLYMRLIKALAILLTLYNTSKFQQSHDLIIGICRCMIELVTFVMHHAQKSKHIIKMFAIHPFLFLYQCMRGFFRESMHVQCGMLPIVIHVYDILLEDNVDYYPKPRCGMVVIPITQ